MTAPRRNLLTPVRAVLLGLALLCMLVQPVLASAHELHEIEHVLAGDVQADEATPIEASPWVSALDGVLHAFDCCLHVSALLPQADVWSPPPASGQTLDFLLASQRSPPAARFLRPPISA